MGTVEVVIKIPEGVLGCVRDIYADGDMPDESSVMETVLYAIANGTVLPKGHGDLVDMNTVTSTYNLQGELTSYDAVVVLEADKEE